MENKTFPLFLNFKNTIRSTIKRIIDMKKDHYRKEKRTNRHLDGQFNESLLIVHVSLSPPPLSYPPLLHSRLVSSVPIYQISIPYNSTQHNIDHCCQYSVRLFLKLSYLVKKNKS